jgi:myo-inositol-1(or 4)-monophosphatase
MSDDVLDVAARAARAGGEYLAGEFRNGPVEGEFGTDDVKAAVDRATERRVLEVIEEAYPEHAIHGEECGTRAGDGYEWVIDPLDGTNNFASGIPCFATAVAALDGGEPAAAAIYEPLPDTLYRVRRGGGARANGDPIAAGSDLPLDRGTVSLVVGLPALRDDDLAAAAERVERELRARSKRVLQTWSPTVDYGLLARGAIEGLVAVHPEPYEHHAGSLLVSEAGARIVERGDVFVGAANGGILDELRAAVAAEDAGG